MAKTKTKTKTVHSETDQSLLLAIAAVLFCLIAVFVLTGTTGFLSGKL
jgi:hypothetical protein